MVVGVVPTINLLLIIELVGVILVLVALHGFASFYQESGIFKNALYGMIAGIIGVAIAVAVILPNLIDVLKKAYPNWNGSWSTITSLSGTIPKTSDINSADLNSLIIAGILALAILCVFSSIETFFFRRSLKQLATKNEPKTVLNGGTSTIDRCSSDHCRWIWSASDVDWSDRFGNCLL
jgi:uncharacterized membrane protein